MVVLRLDVVAPLDRAPVVVGVAAAKWTEETVVVRVELAPVAVAPIVTVAVGPAVPGEGGGRGC